MQQDTLKIKRAKKGRSPAIENLKRCYTFGTPASFSLSASSHSPYNFKFIEQQASQRRISQ
jgi:hypothetical protein